MARLIEVPIDWRERATVDVPVAGLILGGLSINSAYRAAAAGEIPTIGLGARKVVPVAVLRRMLGELADPAVEREVAG